MQPRAPFLADINWSMKNNPPLLIEKIPPLLPCLPAGRLCQREGKQSPLLTKGDEGGLDKLFEALKCDEFTGNG
jgi:hypothetical protein